jgi:hypothetical protein
VKPLLQLPAQIGPVPFQEQFPQRITSALLAGKADIIAMEKANPAMLGSAVRLNAENMPIPLFL